MFDRVRKVPWVLNMPGFWICLWLWISQCSEHTKVLNMSVFWIYQSSEYAWIIPEYAWLCLNMSEYAWICLKLAEGLLFYISFVLYLSSLEYVVTYFNVYTKLEGTWSYFPKETKFDLFYSSWHYVICFSFQTKYFYN